MLTLAWLIICCSESFWMMAFFTTVDRMKGNWQKENLRNQKQSIVSLLTTFTFKSDPFYPSWPVTSFLHIRVCWKHRLDQSHLNITRCDTAWNKLLGESPRFWTNCSCGNISSSPLHLTFRNLQKELVTVKTASDSFLFRSQPGEPEAASVGCQHTIRQWW